MQLTIFEALPTTILTSISSLRPNAAPELRSHHIQCVKQSQSKLHKIHLKLHYIALSANYLPWSSAVWHAVDGARTSNSMRAHPLICLICHLQRA